MLVTLFSTAFGVTTITLPIGSHGCQITVVATNEAELASSTVTNTTKLNSLFYNNFVYSNATYTTSGNCTGLHVYDHAKGETQVLLGTDNVAVTLQVKNLTQCDQTVKQRHYMFDLWNSTQIEQELNLYYICVPGQATSPSTATLKTTIAAVATETAANQGNVGSHNTGNVLMVTLLMLFGVL